MIPFTIRRKIAAIAAAAPSLKKEDNAPDGGFNFVSIDKYYETIGKLCFEHGLLITPIEEQAVREDVTEPAQYFGAQVVTLWRIDLYDLESDQEAIGVLRFTLTHPYQGAQTAGSSISYVEKIAMRVLFKVVTGEKDADFYAKSKVRNQQGATDNTVVVSPFDNQQTETTAESPPPSVRGRGRGRKPEASKEDSPVKEETVVEQQPAQEEDDTPPWEESPADKRIRELTDEFVALVAATKTYDELQQIRVDKSDFINDLKARGDKDQFYKAAQAAFGERYKFFEEQEEQEAANG